MKDTGALPIELIDQLYVEGNLEEVYDILLAIAQNGDRDACVHVACMLFSGEGVEFDYSEALYWNAQALHLGNTKCIFSLAIANQQLAEARQIRKLARMFMQREHAEESLLSERLFQILEIDNIPYAIDMVT